MRNKDRQIYIEIHKGRETDREKNTQIDAERKGEKERQQEEEYRLMLKDLGEEREGDK